MVVAVLVAALAGCASTGQESLNLADQALQAGEPVDALVFATEALIEDPELAGAKAFLKDNADGALEDIRSFLSTTTRSRDLADIERRYDTYVGLVTFYDNLEEIGLPLVDAGALFGIIPGWQWSTPIVDYRPQIEPARAAAHDAFLEAGLARIESADLTEADELLGLVVDKFASGNRSAVAEDRATIAAAFTAHGEGFLGSGEEESLLHAIASFELALSYDNGADAARAALATARMEISDVYVHVAMGLEMQESLEGLIEAVATYQRALEYNPDNAEAETGAERATTSVAEVYYRQGMQRGRAHTDAAEVAAALAAFDQAEEWVSGYRDIPVQRGRLVVADKLIAFTATADRTREGFDEAVAPVETLASLVNSAHTGMERLNSIADRVVQLSGQLRTIDQTLTALSAIPVVGPFVRGIKTPLGLARRPVDASAQSVNRVREPFITPSRNMLSRTKEQVDRITGALDQVRAGIDRARAMGRGLYQYVVLIEDTDTLTLVATEVVALTGAIDEVNEGLAKVNRAQSSASGSLQELADAAELVSRVSSGIERFMRPMDAIDGFTSRIGSALNREVSIPFVGSYSVADALDAANGLVERAARAIIDPILDAFDIDIPTIPGVEELAEMLEKVEGYHNDIRAAAGQVEEAVAAVVDVPGRIDSCYGTIVEATGYR